MPITHSEVEVSNQPIGVTGPLTDTELRATPVPISGTVTATPTGTQDVNVTATVGLTDAQLRATPVPISGTVSIGASPSIATVTPVAVSTTVTTLSSSNAAKTKVIIHNETGTLYVKLGTGASGSSYTYRLTANSVVEISGYTGEITGTKQTGSTTALVTEVGI